jgi:hypothetical protein
MADTNQGAALLLNEAGNIDRARTTDGSIFRIESTLSMEAAEEAKTAAANCKTATDSAVTAEKTRVANENARKTAETTRGNNETTRQNNETSRKNAETTRQDNETARKDAETTRQNNETSRSDAEDERKKAEAQRHDEHVADQQASSDAIAAANGAASRADAAANQALQIANSVAQGSAGSSDIAELRAQNAKLATLLANSTGQFIYMGGTVYCPASKASASGATVAFGSTCSASGNTITLN